MDRFSNTCKMQCQWSDIEFNDSIQFSCYFAKKNENKDRIIIFSDNMQFSDSFCGNFTVVLWLGMAISRRISFLGEFRGMTYLKIPENPLKTQKNCETKI